MNFQLPRMRPSEEFTEAMAAETQTKDRRVLVWGPDGFRFFSVQDINHYRNKMAEFWNRQPNWPATDNSPLPVFALKPPNCWPFAYWTVIEAIDDDSEMYRRGR